MLKIVQSQLSSCHSIQWFNRILPYSWDIVAPTPYHRMSGMRSVAATLFVCSHGNGIGSTDQNVKTCVECHLRWLNAEYSRQTLAVDHFSVKIDQNHLKWETENAHLLRQSIYWPICKFVYRLVVCLYQFDCCGVAMLNAFLLHLPLMCVDWPSHRSTR